MKKIIGWSIFALFILAILLVALGVKGWNTHDGFIFFFKTIFLDNFLAVNALLLGFLTLVGYLILGRGVSNSVIGAIKTIIGVLLLSIGAGMLVGLAKPIFIGLKDVGNTGVKPLDPYFGWASSNAFLMHGIKSGANYVSWVSFALIIGFAFNIVLILFKKWTNVHSLMITGHVMFQQTAIVTALVYLFMFSGWSNLASAKVAPELQVGTIIISGLMMGTYWGTASTATIKGTNKVTNNADFAVGHQQMWGAAIAYKIGKYFGKAEDSAETKKLSKKFKMFEDNIFTQAVIIVVLFLVLILIVKYGGNGWDPAAKEYSSWKIAGGATWVINIFLGSLKIVAAILALTAGVRMFVTELQQAFQGISEKIIPGSVVAVDCAATYGFSPNSVTYGFVSGVMSQFIATGILIGISIGTNGAIPIVIPLFITLFFNSGTVGVFANASGGYKASIIVPAIFGFLEIFLAAGALGMISNSFNDAASAGHVVKDYKTDTGAIVNASPVELGYIGMFDWNAIWSVPFMLGGSSTVVAWIAIPVMFVLMLLSSQIIDSGKQTKATRLQKIFRMKPELVKVNRKEA